MLDKGYLREGKTMTEKKFNDKKEIIRALKFFMFSISAGAIELISFTLMDLIPNFDYVFKAYISITLSVIWNFTFNRKFTFQSVSNVKVAMFKTFCYYIVFAPLSIHFADMYLVKTLGWNEILVKFCTMVLNLVTEFLFQRLFVYRNTCDTAVKKQKEND